jgi:hypothetical protein
MADTHNQAEVKTRYPVVDGLTARTTKQTGHKEQLEPTKSFVRQRIKAGVY